MLRWYTRNGYGPGFADSAAEKPIDRTGHITMVMMKQSDGRWLIRASQNIDDPTGEYPRCDRQHRYRSNLGCWRHDLD